MFPIMKSYLKMGKYCCSSEAGQCTDAVDTRAELSLISLPTSPPEYPTYGTSISSRAAEEKRNPTWTKSDESSNASRGSDDRSAFDKVTITCLGGEYNG